MAAANYSSDVLQRFYGRIDEANQNLPRPLVPRSVTEAIKRLPPELREKIYKEYLAIKLRQRNEMGWNEIHDEMKKKLRRMKKFRQRNEMGWNEIHDEMKEGYWRYFISKLFCQ